MMIDKEQLVNVPQAAKIVGMGKKVELFRYYIKQGYTPEPIKVANKLLFDKRELNGWKPSLKHSKRKYE